MRRAVFWVVAGTVVVGMVFLASHDWLARYCFHRLTGLSTQVHARSLSWRRGVFEARDLVCTNHNAGGMRLTAEVPVLTVTYEPVTLFRRELHLYDLTCEIRQLAVARTARTGAGTPGANSARRTVRIDVVHLKLDGRLAFEQQALTGKLEATLQNVRDFGDLGTLFKSP